MFLGVIVIEKSVTQEAHYIHKWEISAPSDVWTTGKYILYLGIYVLGISIELACLIHPIIIKR